MARTYDAPGGLFAHWIRVKSDTPLHHRWSTQEVDYPFRNSNSHIIRFKPFTFALVVGKWVHSDLTEEDALLAALRGRADAARVVDDEGHLVEQFDRVDF